MSARRNDKISTDGGDAFGANPFGGLDAAGLPAGEVLPRSASAKKKSVKSRSKGRVEIRREKAGRGGKTVTTLKEFPTHIPLSTLEAMTFELKKICACGGTLKGRIIELQGDVCERVCVELNARGYQAVRAGG
ncbi:translation initiation factor [Coraliomargarita sp. SDUM461004]|uniref:Translation initiation factor n=1 Tax=Thalassobacterium sedimentorum TaxID=3041258 RepID=A0ABU1AKK9_9BACT|nr:translation initiation factor [Coraliomargarita sp. SDUM461004]MDQ8195354.1 translation initiation factor [Coraliomargarita sp. SDUM461004]